jgi:L-asparaginase
MLEDDPRFNSGTGSVLQSDGQIRMSASLMDGTTQSFSGVINVSRVQNPIELAQFLQNSPDRVLSDYGSAELAREMQIPSYNALTELRLQEWMQERQDNFKRTMAGVVAEPELVETSNARRGTIGVVVLDTHGRLAVGTSTGGKGFERIGRVSDSAMPAGNYATVNAAVSCTGIGEDIIDECLHQRLSSALLMVCHSKMRCSVHLPKHKTTSGILGRSLLMRMERSLGVKPAKFCLQLTTMAKKLVTLWNGLAKT